MVTFLLVNTFRIIEIFTKISDLELFNIKLIDFADFSKLFVRFTLNMIVLLLLVRWLYYNIAKRKDYLFSYILIGTIIFLLCYMLKNINPDMGFALGLFAIFGIIRYRTQQIPIKEMTYLFLVIGISVINGLANKKVSYAELIFTNLIILAVTYGLEKLWLLRHESTKIVTYEKIEMIKPENRVKLIEDLQVRTGIQIINRIEIGKVDLLRDTVRIKIYYFDDINTADDEEISSSVDNGDDD